MRVGAGKCGREQAYAQNGPVQNLGLTLHAAIDHVHTFGQLGQLGLRKQPLELPLVHLRVSHSRRCTPLPHPSSWSWSSSVVSPLIQHDALVLEPVGGTARKWGTHQ